MKLRPFMSHFNSPRDQISTPRVTKTAVNTQKRLNILSKPKNPHSHCTMHSPTQPMDQSTFNPTQSRLSPLGNNATVRSHTCSKSNFLVKTHHSSFIREGRVFHLRGRLQPGTLLWRKRLSFLLFHCWRARG